MKRYGWLTIAGLLVLAFVVLQQEKKQTTPPDAKSPTSSPAFTPATTPAVVSSVLAPSSTISAPTAEDRDLILAAIDNLSFTFRDYAAALGGNPVGSNEEITAALLGDNEKQIKLPLPAGSTLNERRELCDPWRTPWFFHQLSGKQMEIRSAGPDRILYTSDDFTR